MSRHVPEAPGRPFEYFVEYLFNQNWNDSIVDLGESLLFEDGFNFEGGCLLVFEFEFEFEY